MKTRILSIFLVIALIVGMLPFMPMVKAYAENQNLMLWYKFNQNNGVTITDSSGSGRDGKIKGDGASINDGTLTLSNTSYVELPTGMFDGHNSLTISMWLKNDTGSGNYSAMFFGTKELNQSQYWLFNPCNPANRFKSVITNKVNASAPWNTECGISPTNASQGIAGPTTDSNWAFYTTVIEPNSITAYYNNVKIGTVATSRKVSEFGKNLVAYIGKSSYSDPTFKGSIKDVKVYGSALTEEQLKEENVKTILEKDKDTLNITDTSVVNNLTLPITGVNGSAITWKSSNTKYITDDGKVTRPEGGNGDENVTMTATLSQNGMQVTKDFNIIVIENSLDKDFAYLNNIAKSFDIGVKYVTQDLSLPTSTKEGISVDWRSSNEDVLSSAGKLTRPESGDKDVTLTAILKFGQANTEKTFDVIVAEKAYGYLLSYVVGGDTDRTDCLHLAYSDDGENYTALNDNNGIVYTSKGSNKFGSPNIFRKADGTYGLIASDNNNNSYIIVMDSDDLITYKNERYSQVNNEGIKVIDPYCYFDSSVNAYRIYFNGSDGKSYTTTTKDFVDFTNLETSNYTKVNVTGNIPEGAMESSIFEVTQTEYDRVVQKYSRIKNTGIKPVQNVEIQAGNQVALPEKVTAEYSDGSTKDMGVIWDQDQLNSIDITKSGTYTIKGKVQQTIYTNPLIEERADPDVVLGDDGYYYFTASYPTYGDKDTKGYDRVILRRAKSIEELKDAEEITIWDVYHSSKAFRYIWAPEMHYIDGKWYVFYTASRSSNVWDIRPHILACEGDGDPYKPENWVEKGQVKPTSGDTTSFSNFSLDMTYFESEGKSYVIWAEKPNGISNLYMATVDPSAPWQLTSKAIQMTTPQYAWEWQGNTKINEGPAVLKHDGKVFLFYSASAVDASYCVGMLSADENDDLMNISSWTKSNYPLLSTDDLNDEYGPGHNSFTVDAYGNPVIVYHARPEECMNNTCEYASSSDLNDPHRHARAKNLNFAVDGSPILNMTYEEELADENKDITVTVNINGSVENIKQIAGVSIEGKALAGNVLSAQLIDEDGNAVTTSSAVTYEWYKSSDKDFEDAELIGENDSYNIVKGDIGQYIKLIASYNDMVFNDITSMVTDEESNSEEEPTGVKIKGTEKVGNTLIADLIDKDGNVVTTSAAVTYEWYRSSNKDFEDAELIGEDSNYKIMSVDVGKYIKIVVNYVDKVFEDITSKITKKSSSSSSHKHKGSSSKSDITSNLSESETKEDSNNVTTNTGNQALVTGNWQRGEEGWKYFENNTPVVGWKLVNNIWYFMNEAGIMQTGWKEINNKWYYLNEDGAMETGWQSINGQWYYLSSDGGMVIGWQQINNIWYYFYDSGSMASNTIINGYTVNQTGAWI